MEFPLPHREKTPRLSHPFQSPPPSPLPIFPALSGRLPGKLELSFASSPFPGDEKRVWRALFIRLHIWSGNEAETENNLRCVLEDVYKRTGH